MADGFSLLRAKHHSVGSKNHLFSHTGGVTVGFKLCVWVSSTYFSPDLFHYLSEIFLIYNCNHLNSLPSEQRGVSCAQKCHISTCPL